ncbi:MAG: hypothetical protein AAB482_03960 [Patescibacteria group bacterium]
MILLFSLFAITFFGMLIVPLRHVAELRSTSEDEVLDRDAGANSIACVRIVGTLDWFEHWYETTAKNAFLKLTDRALGVFERTAGKVAGQTKNVRVMVQERFKVIPRESLYWKQIHSWKREGSGVKAKFVLEEEGIDFSNHPDARSKISY